MKPYGKIDTIEMALDYAIRDFEIEKDGIDYGYRVEWKKAPYMNYLSNESWSMFLGNMRPMHKSQFLRGSGDELSVRKVNGLSFPPKMASFGSSSRLIYNLSNQIAGFEFEKQLPTKVGHTAHLDGYLRKQYCDVFVEAKCREIYSTKSAIQIRNVYQRVYDYIMKRIPVFSYSVSSDDDSCFDCSFSYDGKYFRHFDLKQLICHYLAMCANLLENDDSNPNMLFVYLIFDPHHDTDFSTHWLSWRQNQILEEYEATIAEMRLFGDMKSLFDVVMDFQCSNLGLLKREYSFDFKLVSQEEYCEAVCQDIGMLGSNPHKS